MSRLVVVIDNSSLLESAELHIELYFDSEERLERWMIYRYGSW